MGQNINRRDFCEALLMRVGETPLERDSFQLGLTKVRLPRSLISYSVGFLQVFFRPGKQDFMEKILEGVSDCAHLTFLAELLRLRMSSIQQLFPASRVSFAKRRYPE